MGRTVFRSIAAPLAAASLFLAACESRSPEEMDRETLRGMGIDPRLFDPPPPPSLDVPSPRGPTGRGRFSVEKPLVTAVENETCRIQVSGSWPGTIIECRIEVPDGKDFAVRMPFRIAALDFEGAVFVALFPDGALSRSQGEAVLISRFVIAGGGRNFTHQVSLSGKGLLSAQVQYDEKQPGFLIGEPCELRLGMAGGDGFCALLPGTWAGGDYRVVLRAPKAAEGAPPAFPGGKCALAIFGAPDRYLRLAVVEAGGVSIEGGAALPEAGDPLHRARRAFAGGDLEGAAALYAEIGELGDEDGIAFRIASSGKDPARRAAAVDDGLARWPNCETLVRPWAARMLAEGKREEVRARAEALLGEEGKTSTRLAEILGELAENAEPPVEGEDAAGSGARGGAGGR